MPTSAPTRSAECFNSTNLGSRALTRLDPQLWTLFGPERSHEDTHSLSGQGLVEGNRRPGSPPRPLAGLVTMSTLFPPLQKEDNTRRSRWRIHIGMWCRNAFLRWTHPNRNENLWEALLSWFVHWAPRFLAEVGVRSQWLVGWFRHTYFNRTWGQINIPFYTMNVVAGHDLKVLLS